MKNDFLITLSTHNFDDVQTFLPFSIYFISTLLYYKPIDVIIKKKDYRNYYIKEGISDKSNLTWIKLYIYIYSFFCIL